MAIIDQWVMESKTLHNGTCTITVSSAAGLGTFTTHYPPMIMEILASIEEQTLADVVRNEMIGKGWNEEIEVIEQE